MSGREDGVWNVCPEDSSDVSREVAVAVAPDSRSCATLMCRFAAYASEGLCKARILQNPIRRMNVRHIHWQGKTSLGDRAVPDLVTTLTHADEVAAGSDQLTPNRRI